VTSFKNARQGQAGATAPGDFQALALVEFHSSCFQALRRLRASMRGLLRHERASDRRPGGGRERHGHRPGILQRRQRGRPTGRAPGGPKRQSLRHHALGPEGTPNRFPGSLWEERGPTRQLMHHPGRQNGLFIGARPWASPASRSTAARGIAIFDAGCPHDRLTKRFPRARPAFCSIRPSRRRGYARWIDCGRFP
jgi:hypothetical protein